ncbi:MAG: type IV secretion system protein [Sphingomicrobium sp.]
MSGQCTAAATERFAAQLLADTDCQAFGLVERGYAALAQPGGTMSTALTGLLIIAVAFFGYRLLLGRGLILADAVGLTVKIGIVLLIATSWESWSTLAYNGLAKAPTEIAGEMLVGIGAAPPLDSLQLALDNLTAATVGYRTRAGIASPLVGGPAAAAAVLNLSAVVLTLATVGILVAARIVLAILLAIAPAMAGLLLFNGTRGMAQGWLGGVAAAALAPMFVLLVAAVEFAILGPMIARLLAEQAAGTFENTAVMPIGLVVVVFVFALIFALRSGARIAYGVRLGMSKSAASAATTAGADSAAVAERTVQVGAPTTSPRVAQALELIARRDAPPASGRARFASVRASGSSATGLRAGSSAPSGTTIFTPMQARRSPLRHAPRRTRAAARRDG